MTRLAKGVKALKAAHYPIATHLDCSCASRHTRFTGRGRYEAARVGLEIRRGVKVATTETSEVRGCAHVAVCLSSLEGIEI